MKKVLFIFSLLISVLVAKANQDERFVKAMEATLLQFREAKDLNAFQEIANKFERIGNSEPNEWLPNYYGGLVYTIMAARVEASERDKYLDKADVFVEKLEKQISNNDEVEVLKGQVALMRISVDGQSRWMKYGQVFEGAIAKAKSINPENPRAYSLKAQNLFYTPEQFGGGLKNACPEIQKSLEKFAGFKPASSISPNWGEGEMKALAKKCQ
ncbi:hypothetical protein SAMN04515674_11979 [Pseudarcicella hirudinis]|uniref:Tetratricopeptide repeat protein n=1 Tax=Pseudarcicella hirudinis TaxID=1079859 RepID=A0A1I5YKI9_9BACT|nr:hypothetical protein [Pseudarcicella hirudinis]SFQ44759.1 hypothetical protein SAMN04515674_11979 [Pseudarcicella hirudinis]